MIRICAKDITKHLLPNTRLFSTNKTITNIEFQDYDGFTKVLINRPQALNALNLQMYQALHSQLINLEKAKVIWFEGAGGKAFSAGGDIKEYFSQGATSQHRLTFARQEFTTQFLIADLPAYEIAVWDGIVMGGGFGLTSMAEYRIATEKTIFAMPQGKIGYFTDVSSCYTFCRMRGNLGYYLGMTGARLKGQDVYIAGLANYYIPSQHLPAIFQELKQALPQSNHSKEMIQQVLNKYHQPSGRKIVPDQTQIHELFGLTNFRDIYKKVAGQNDPFCIDTTKMLQQQCPLSVGIIHRLIQTAKGKSFKECYKRDFKISQHLLEHHNFREGVRTVLIDKGDKPVWSHKSILDVTDEEVEAFFNFPSTFEELQI